MFCMMVNRKHKMQVSPAVFDYSRKMAICRGDGDVGFRKYLLFSHDVRSTLTQTL